MIAKPEPKIDWIRYWPVVLGVVGFTIAYAEMRSQIGYNTSLLRQQSSIFGKTEILDTVLTRHLREPAHGLAGDRITAAEREVAVLRAQMKEILRRLNSIDSKLNKANIGGK